VCLAAALVLLAAGQAEARHFKSESWAKQQYSKAERLREALNGRPAEERTRGAYRQVMEAYRRVYYGSPTSSKADPSVVAVAELLVEMGRRFEDGKVLRSAIGQYEFLRREYPGSRYRFDALFTIGEIYKDDLNDPDKARETFKEFVRRYPHNRLAEQARAELAEPVEQAGERKPAPAAGTPKKIQDAPVEEASDSTGKDDADARLARVTGIRHWSTPDYTRVAIDLEHEIKFESQRITNPDRIFFDLKGTKLASTLVGKSFDVDDGFLKKVRVAQYTATRTRVVLEVDSLSQYTAFLLPNPYRLIIDIHGKDVEKSKAAAPEAKEDEKAASSTTSATQEKTAKAADEDDKPATKPGKRSAKKTEDVVIKAEPTAAKTVSKNADAEDSDSKEPAAKTETTTEEKTAKITDLGSRKSKRAKGRKTESGEVAAREARPTASGDRSLIRALGLKIGKIVIDPGHGGHDTGTIGPNGVREKDVVLDVSRRLGKLLQQRLGADVVYTRADDTFIPLETRTAIANRTRADLFVSVHANSSDDPDARGVETYYLNFTSSKDALEVAARENAVSQNSIHELQDLVKKIALKEKIEESKEFASDVQTALHGGLAAKNSSIRNRGVRKAPFIVLIGANMPSILAEISFVSNPTDAKKLETAEYRQKIAESLYRGIARYVNGLSGVKVASHVDHGDGE
jgi:N-acetylmuramoyl-L-alanine amidase